MEEPIPNEIELLSSLLIEMHPLDSISIQTLSKTSHETTPPPPIKVARRLARLGKWNLFISYCKNHPSIYQWEGSYGQTLLHYICSHRPSLEAVHLLIDQYPQSISKQDDENCLPIHMAMSNGASDPVLKALIQGAPGTIRIPNRWGHTAFQWIWNRQKGILEGVQNPVSSFMSWHMVVVLIQAAAIEANTSCMSHNSDDVEIESNQINHGNLLHLVTDFDAPLDLLEAVLKTFPIMIKEADENGCLPLARLSSNRKPNSRKQKVDTLIRANSEAVMVPNGQGRFPFHLAIASGMNWDDGLQSIFAVSPDILRVCDPVTNLVPFILAAEHCNLNDIFTLLRLSPDIIPRSGNVK